MMIFTKIALCAGVGFAETRQKTTEFLHTLNYQVGPTVSCLIGL